MFYQCLKCKKVWQYPIEKCPECFLKLERLSSEKIKVIGVSKVNISTIFHQKVPYFVLLLEDEKGNKWVQKSIKEYKISEEWTPLDNKHLMGQDKNLPRTELALVRGAVALWRIKYDILEAIENVVELLGGLTPNQKSWWGAKILILPTLISPKHPYFAENTTPQFLESLIKYLLEIGAEAKNIKVACQSFNDVPVENSVQKSQLLKVCQDYKILPLDLAKTGFIKKDGLEISEEAFNADLIINLPIIKLDSNLGVRGAAENALKFLRKESYLSLQRLPNPEETMGKLQKILPGHLTIAEGNYIQTASGFVAFLGIVLASFNSFNLDRIFAEICEIKPLPEWLKKVKIESIPIIGREIEEVQLNVEKI